MRKDIYERMKIMKQDEIKPNYAALAKQLGCDYRTVKRYYEHDLSGKVNKPPNQDILEGFITKPKTRKVSKESNDYV